MPNQDNINPEYKELAKKYGPYLVMYPDIVDGSEREKSYRPIGERPGHAPLLHDYHPRDIRFILDQVWFRGKKKNPSPADLIEDRNRVLDMMSENRVKHIDLIDRSGPRHVNKFWSRYAGIGDKDSEKSEYKRKAYARVVRGDKWFKDYISIQYWMAFFFDDWANVHEMDWEMVSVIIKKTDTVEKPVACVYNSHIGSFRKPWEQVRKVGDDEKESDDGLHPVAFIANGSHAAYYSDYPPHFNVISPYLGNVLKTVLRASNVARTFYDYTPYYEERFRCLIDVELIPPPDVDIKPENGEATSKPKMGWSGDFRWLNFEGKWGSPVEMNIFERIISKIPVIKLLARFFQRPLREAGPPGPNTRGACWEEPLIWANLHCLPARDVEPWLYKQD